MEDKPESRDAVWLSVRFWLAKIVDGMKCALASKNKNGIGGPTSENKCVEVLNSMQSSLGKAFEG